MRHDKKIFKYKQHKAVSAAIKLHKCKRRLKGLEELNAPSCIINKEKTLISKASHEFSYRTKLFLKKYGTGDYAKDIEKFFGTIAMLVAFYVTTGIPPAYNELRDNFLNDKLKQLREEITENEDDIC